MSFVAHQRVIAMLLLVAFVAADAVAQRRVSISKTRPTWRPSRSEQDPTEQVHQTPNRQASSAGSARLAQNRRPAQEPTTRQRDELVRLDLGPEVELRKLADRVSKLLGINIIYDSDLLNAKIRIAAPEDVRTSVLLPLLQSALQLNGLALEGQSGVAWKRIVPAANLSQVSSLGEGQIAVTKIFHLNHTDPVDVESRVRSFMTQAGNSRSLKYLRVLIVTDYAQNMERIGQLVHSLDSSGAEIRIQPIPLQHSDALQLSEQVSTLLKARFTARSGSAGVEGSTAIPEISVDSRTNQLIVIGDRTQINEVSKIVTSLDIPINTQTKAYKFQNAKASRVARVVEDLVDTGVSGRFSSAIDADSNQLLVTATPAVIDKIDKLVASLDKSPPPEQSRVRFHKIQNVTANELLMTLRSLQGNGDFLEGDMASGARIRGVSNGIRSSFPSRSNRGSGRDAPFVPGANRPATPGQMLPEPPALFESRSGNVVRGQNPPADPDSQLVLPSENARITADESSNSLIIVAEPEVQRVYAELIKTLDRRRPQVLIEAKVVVIDTTDDYTLGVEVSGGDQTGSRKLFNFTSFGLSTVDPVTGALALIPGFGYNGTLVDPETADVVVRALTSHRRARVISAPRVLVNDNALGLLTSVDEVPFSSVNASNVVATTSFAGFAEAGTTIEVTPHISNDNYLQLEYRFLLNTFTGTGGDGIPPPRKTNEVSSVVTIPDGHTVIVGGLNQSRKSQEVESIPWIEKIPVVKYLASLDAQQQANSTMFLFLRPVILRDDKFKKLKFYSERDTCRSGESGDFPVSGPILMRPKSIMR